jgi:hypothetical protein
MPNPPTLNTPFDWALRVASSVISYLYMYALALIVFVIFPGWFIKIVWMTGGATFLALVAIVIIGNVVLRREGRLTPKQYAIAAMLAVVWPIALMVGLSNDVERYMNGEPL